METNLLDKMLSMYLAHKTPVTIVLQNKARITGTIRTFDSYVIVMDDQKHGMVYRHAISLIHPAVAEEHLPARKEKVPQAHPAARPVDRSAKHAPPVPAKGRHEQAERQPALSPAASGINTGMKEGLLRWLQEQKAGK